MQDIDNINFTSRDPISTGVAQVIGNDLRHLPIYSVVKKANDSILSELPNYELDFVEWWSDGGEQFRPLSSGKVLAGRPWCKLHYRDAESQHESPVWLVYQHTKTEVLTEKKIFTLNERDLDEQS